MKLMAIDPGLKGGIAIFDEVRNLMKTSPMLSGKLSYGGKGKPHKLISLAWIRQEIADYDVNTVVLEVPSAMPGQSSVATATAFTNWGLLLALASSVHLHFVYPQMWKKAYGLGSSKTAAIAKARECYATPTGIKWTDGTAEAALIGTYWLNGGSERERAYTEKQRTRPKRRKRTAARQPASVLKRRASRPRASSRPPVSAPSSDTSRT